MWEGAVSKRWGRRGKQVTQGQDSIFVPTRQQLSRESNRTGKKEKAKKKKNHKKKELNSYLPTPEEVESCTDVGNPVDPL